MNPWSWFFMREFGKRLIAFLQLFLAPVESVSLPRSVAVSVVLFPLVKSLGHFNFSKPALSNWVKLKILKEILTENNSKEKCDKPTVRVVIYPVGPVPVREDALVLVGVGSVVARLEFTVDAKFAFWSFHKLTLEIHWSEGYYSTYCCLIWTNAGIGNLNSSLLSQVSCFQTKFVFFSNSLIKPLN